MYIRGFLFLHVNRREFSIQKRLQKPSGGNRIQLLFFLFVRQLFACFFPFIQLLLGSEAAEAFVDVDDPHGNQSTCR